MRTVPADVRVSVEREASPDAILGFMTITHPALVEPIRVVSDVINYVRDGATWAGVPFGFTAVSDEEAAPTAELRVQNVDRRMGEILNALPDRAVVQLEILSSADFDLSVEPRQEIGTAAVIYGYSRFELVEVSVGPVEITGRLMLRDPTQEPWPGVSATQSRLPGLFR